MSRLSIPEYTPGSTPALIEQPVPPHSIGERMLTAIATASDSVAKAVTAKRRQLAIEHTIKELMRLDDLTLQDIGVHRDEIPVLARAAVDQQA